MAKISRPMWLMIGVGAIAITYMYTSEEQAAGRRTTKKPTSTKAAKLPEGVTEEDYKAKFAALNESPKNSFVPIIARTTAGGLSGSANEPDAIPQEYAGGEPGWYFTGTAEVNGVQQALVENRTTAIGDFLVVGQTWKRVKVTGIGDNTLTLVGPNGQPKTLKLSYGITGQTMANSATVRPLDPTLSGPIGGRGAVGLTPDNSSGNGRRGGRGNSGNAAPMEAGAENEGF